MSGAAVLSAGLRDGTDADAPHFIRLVRDAWGEYPSVVFDLDAELPELRHLQTHFAQLGGRVWLADDLPSDDRSAAGREGLNRPAHALGMIATRPMREDAAWEICRLYLDRAARGTGLAQRLLRAAEDHARANGAQRMVLWTDTRFEAAHAFYEKHGYVRQGAIRILDDLSKSLEFRYSKPARGLVVEALDAAAAASAERRLSRIAVESVADGAALGWRRPLAPEKARAYWKHVSSEVAQNHRVLLAAWSEGELVGTAQLVLDLPETQPHRAMLEKLMVAPEARGRGVGEALARRAEQAAQRLGRRLLTLHARAGDGADRLFRRLGWQVAGTIPGFALDASGKEFDMALFWKRVA